MPVGPILPPPASAAAFLAELSDRELLRELLVRVDTDGDLAHPELTQPLDETHPVFDLPIDLHVVNEKLEGGRVAADWLSYPPDDEQTQRHDT